MSEVILQARRASINISGARQAHVEVNKAVARGDLPPASARNCVDCGEPAKAYDHRDYSRPLDVEPVCNACNAKRGAALPNPETVLKHQGSEMERELNWRARKSRPALLAGDVIAGCRTYREAVRLGWDLRASQNMTRATLAECIGAYASHVTDYFHKDDAPFRRNLPPELINDFEWAVGNRAVTQYLARKAELTIMDEVIAARAA